MTRAEIITKLRVDNPTSWIDGQQYGQGEDRYESELNKWADAMESEASPPPEPAPMWKVNLWLRGIGVTDAMMEGIIESAYPDEIERDKALIRWRRAPLVGIDHEMVPVIVARLAQNGVVITPAEVWDQIHAVTLFFAPGTKTAHFPNSPRSETDF